MPGHSVAERIMSMKNPNKPTVNQTSNLPACSAASYAIGTGSWPGVKQPGHDVDHPLPSRVEVKERVDLYLYSPSRPSWPVCG
jgi:hypothetical protein